MAATAKWYGLGQRALARKEVDWTTDAIKVLIAGSGYTPDQDAHDYLDDVVSNEISGTNYTAGGVLLTSCAVSYDSATNRCRLTAANAVWTNVTFTNGRYGIVYNSSPSTNATRPLLGYVDFGANQSPTGINFQITWDATDGVLYLAAS
ncbi:hypothetical protein IU459_26940 [Nocardia amamiensis]|uniref:Bacteriophage protein n=1 Tax=Nocardia amamiensis TaxID=404578 RepID=A0ABS0CX24_9NOCA|nr:hypothetical protein [Nocardia amamiensis]MBF6301152.1 hypothetical protein [Nocardia amamiensis]